MVGLALSAMIAAVVAPSATAAERHSRSSAYQRLASYPVYLNAPSGADPTEETVAEISTVTRDGKTVIYTDAAQQRIGFLDIGDPSAPSGLGTLSTLDPGDTAGEPTSVVVAGAYALVVVDTSPPFSAPSGRLDVIRIADRVRVRSVELGGQPDSIALSPDGAYAAIVIENQRDEEFTPPGGEEGGLPQLPAGISPGGRPRRRARRLVGDPGPVRPPLTELPYRPSSPRVCPNRPIRSRSTSPSTRATGPPSLCRRTTAS